MFPVQIQADKHEANDTRGCLVLCHVFDHTSQVCLLDVLSKQFAHVAAWDAQGNKIYEYDNR